MKREYSYILSLPSKGKEGGVGEFLEVVEVFTVGTSHCLHHFLAKLHGGWHGLGVATQHVAKINMEEFT